LYAWFVKLSINEQDRWVERREIEIFLAVADELHFTRAAERLRVSTARVSQTIKQLERRVGVPLFERSSRRVALTPVGQRLYEDLRPAYEQIQTGVERAVRAGREVRGRLRVGFVGAAAGQFVLDAARVFQARHPDCDVQIRENQVTDAFGPLRADEIDVLLTTLPVSEPDLTTGPVLFCEDVLLAVSARHPFARRASIAFAEVTRDTVLGAPPGQPAYRDAATVAARTPDGRAVRRGPPFSTIQEMLALVGAGRGVYPVPAQALRFYVRPDVAYVPIPDAPPVEWVLVWRTAGNTPRIRAFGQAMRTTRPAGR
jgi:DNA-binding transcriptional LysR family regulator